MKKKELKASLTIEMSVIIPMVLFILMGVIVTMFYYHDKNIIYGAAYETAVVGSMDMRKKEPVTEEKLEAFCKERLRKKCIVMTSQRIEVEIQEEEILVRILSAKKGFKVLAERRAPVTTPEKNIRDIRRLDI